MSAGASAKPGISASSCRCLWLRVMGPSPRRFDVSPFPRKYVITASIEDAPEAPPRSKHTKVVATGFWFEFGFGFGF